MKSNFFIWFFLIINNIIIYSQIINDNICSKETPLFNKNSQQCVLEPFIEGTHEISNSIIKDQWLNKMNILGGDITWYFGSDFTYNRDFIIQSFNYVDENVKTKRYLYGIKNNGRALFYLENKFTTIISIDSTSTVNKFESQFLKIKLINDDENDYFLSPCFEDFSIDMLDLNNNQIFGANQKDFLGNIIISTKIYSVFELNNQPKNYLFCFILKDSHNYYISFQKFTFNNADISQTNNYEKVSYSQLKDELKVHKSLTITCIEISKYNIIQCFYINTTNYLTIGLFKEDSYDIIQSKIIEETIIPESEISCSECNFYYQCIHLKKEISILAYTLGSNNHDDMYIQLKNILYNNNNSNYEIDDYLLGYNKILIKLVGTLYFRTYYYTSHLKTINDNKFSLISSSHDLLKLYVFIFDLYKQDTNLFIRYYIVELKLFNFQLFRYLRTITFNDFIGLIFSTNDVNTGSNNLDFKYQRFSIFSYVNGTDSELINLEANTVFKLSDYISEENIENNIFGVELYGIKILKLPDSNENGVYFYSKLKRNLIYENDILSPQDEIYFIYDKNKLKFNEKYTIEIAGIVKEKSYSESIIYTIYSQNYGDSSYELYYQPTNKIGRTCFYNFTINENIITNYISCIENCKICFENACLKCNDNYKLIIDDSYNCQETIPNNYYYDETYNAYRKCHGNCKTCLSGPIYYNDNLEIEDTNCEECIENYFKIENTNNCIYKDNPPERHYLDINNNFFIKCHENCKTCSQGPINSTYFSCLSCDDNNMLYPESASCIDFIPEGYYLKDEENKILDKCYFSCKICNLKGDPNDHKCLECGETFIYKNKEGTKCIDDCLKEYSYVDIETRICYNDCIENIVTERKYNFNHECKKLEDKPDNYEVIDNKFIRICNNQTDYFFNNECYEDNCPEGTKLNILITTKKICICNNLYYINDSQLICINSTNCPNEYPVLDPNTLECKKCKFKYNNQCVLSCPKNTYNQTNEDFIICINIINEEEENQNEKNNNLLFNFSKILDKIEKLNYNNNIVINDYPNVTINIYIDGVIIDKITEVYPNLTIINLGKCGEELKLYYKLNSNDTLFIATFETYNNIRNRVTNQYYFEIYLKNGTQLEDLSVCRNLSILVSSSISKFDLVNFEEAEIFNSQGYNIYNLSSEFYIDKCSGANINGNDIVIKDRIEDIYPDNISFCPNGCELKDVEIENIRVNCSCNMDYKEEDIDFSYDSQKLIAKENFFIYLLDKLNYKIFKCYKILFKIDIITLLSNVGFLIGIGVILFVITNCFIFFFSILPKIRIRIFQLIPKKKNLSKKNILMNFNNMKINNKKSRYNFNYRKINSKFLSKKNNILKTKIKKSFLNNNQILKKKSNNESEKISWNKNKKSKNNKIEEKEFNYLPYSLALKLDKRNICPIFISIIKKKIEIFSILFYQEEFTHKPITLSVYALVLLVSFFMNAFLYTDDVVSEKYHNNGKLNFLTTLLLSLTSNILSSLLIFFMEKLVSYREYLPLMVKIINREYFYIKTFNKLYKLLKVQVSFFFAISLILSILMTLYILIFCQIYKKSQNSLLINYAIGLIESLIYSLGISLLICNLRCIGLKYKLIYFYRTSVYLDQIF